MYWAEIKNAFFIEAVNCLVAYANNNQFKLISLDAITMLRLCAKRLYGGEVIILSVGEDGVLFTESNNHTKLWFPLLTGLAKVVNHAHIDVRSSALDVLRNILISTGGCFSEKLWGNKFFIFYFLFFIFYFYFLFFIFYFLFFIFYFFF